MLVLNSNIPISVWFVMWKEGTTYHVERSDVPTIFKDWALIKEALQCIPSQEDRFTLLPSMLYAY